MSADIRKIFIVPLLVFGTVIHLSPDCSSQSSEEQYVQFATARSQVLVVDKTPEEFRRNQPDRKILECILRLSATANIDESEISRLEYVFHAPPDCVIADYLPKTTLGSEISSLQIQTDKSDRQVQITSLEGGARVGFTIPGLDVGSNASGATENQNERSSRTDVRMDVLPPKVLVQSASTFNDGRSLRIRLQQRSQVALEGDRDYVLLLEVPSDFEQGLILVSCSCYFKNSAIKPIGRRRDIAIMTKPVSELVEQPLITKKWESFEPETFSTSPGMNRSREVEAAEEKVYGVEVLDGVWNYKTYLGILGIEHSGSAKIKGGRLKLLDGILATLDIDWKIEGNSKDGFRATMSDETQKFSGDVIFDGTGFTMSFPQKYILQPVRLENRSGFEAVSKE